MASAQSPNWKYVEGLNKVQFRLVKHHTDEFNGNSLDYGKWDAHALRNANTGCSKWNGPIDWTQRVYSTYHQTTTELDGTKTPSKNLNFRVWRGILLLRTTKKPVSYFQRREYYCNKNTFRCNHDRNIRCYGTKYNGEPILRDNSDPTSYLWVNHDKCKKEPFCIPHPRHVKGASRKYRRYLGVNLAMKRPMRYGYFETRAKIAKSPAVTAVWMHDDNMVPGYDRWIFDEEKGWYIFESPTAMRSRRWQEIDILEAMNSDVGGLSTKYIPNIHIFAAYKGEYTKFRSNITNLGPIILDRDVFTQPNPLFDPPNPDRSNTWHMNYGSTETLKTKWGNRYYTVGMYWSRREIRFLLNGVETLRLKNRIVHQPMFWTIGTGLNKQWAGRAPSNAEVGRWSRIDYVRRWIVRTTGGRDPPSELPLLDLIGNSFTSFGNKYGAVDGVFPVKDDGLTIENPARMFEDVFGDMLGKMQNGQSIFSSWSPSPTPTTSPTPSTSPSQSVSPSPSRTPAVEEPEEMEVEPEAVDSKDDPVWRNSGDQKPDETMLSDAAGSTSEATDGTSKSSSDVDETGFKKQMSPDVKRGQETRQDRFRQADKEPQCDAEAARSAYEDTNPDTNLAGWATQGGTGKDAGVVPRGQCA